MSFQVSEADCIVSNFVSHDGEASLTCSVLVNNRLEVSIIKEVKPNPKCLKLMSGSIYIEELPIYNFLSSSQPCPASLVASTSRQSENPREDTREREVKLAIDEISPHDKMSSIMGYTPLKLSQEEIKDIRFLPGFKSRVLRKSFTRDSGGVLKAEKTSAVSMCHKNILRLIGYHKTENAAILVFPSAEKGSLDMHLCSKFHALFYLLANFFKNTF
jgi:hypothetical protein